MKPIARISAWIGFAAHHVPRIGRDRAAWPHNPNHLGDAFGRLGNEENHQRHNGAIEPAVGAMPWRRPGSSLTSLWNFLAAPKGRSVLTYRLCDARSLASRRRRCHDRSLK